MARKSGRPTGAGRPSGTPEQRAYYGAPTTPSGTPREAPSAELQAQLRKDIEADPTKYNLSEYSYLYPGGYPYAIEGKAVSQQQFQTYQQQLAREAKRQEQIQVGRTQAKTFALEAMSPRVLQEFARKATPQERMELFRGSQYQKLLEGSKGTIAFQKLTPEGKQTRLYGKPEPLPPYQPPPFYAKYKPSALTQKYLPPYEETYRGKQIKGVSLIDPLIAKSKTLQRFYGKSDPFFTGIEKGYYEDFRTSPTKNILLFGLPFGVKATGTLLKGGGGYLGRGASWLGKTKAGTTVTGVISKGLDIPLAKQEAVYLGKKGLAGAGAWLGLEYISPKIKAFETKDYKKKGQIVGGTAAELTSLGLGSVSTDALFGKLRTFRKTKADVDVRYGFPTAPTGKHFELFEEAKYKGLLPGEPAPKFASPEEYARFNLYQQLKFGREAKYPSGHAYPHLEKVGMNIQKLMKAYPEYDPYWIKTYGSVSKARTEVTKGMWHDLLKVSAASEKKGIGHGEQFYQLWRTGKLPKELKIMPRVAGAIRLHERPPKYAKTPELKFLQTADIFELKRYGIDIPTPLKGARERLSSFGDFTFEFKPPRYTKKMEIYRKEFLGKYNIRKGKVFEKGFKGDPYAYHASIAPFFGRKFKVKPGKSELPILYGTPGTFVSGEFLKTSGEYKFFGFDFPTLSTPRVLRLRGKGLRKGLGEEKGILYVPGKKREIEGGFILDTRFQLLGKEFYGKTRGQSFTIERYKVIPEADFFKLPKAQQRRALTYEQYLRRSSSGAGRRSLLDPFSLSISSRVSRTRRRAPSSSFAMPFSSLVSPLISRRPSARRGTAPSISRVSRGRDPFKSFFTYGRSTGRYADPFTSYGYSGSSRQPRRAGFDVFGFPLKTRRATQLKRGKRTRRKDYGYMPSFTSIFYGTTRKGAPRKGQIFTGLEMRPIFELPRRRRR